MVKYAMTSRMQIQSTSSSSPASRCTKISTITKPARSALHAVLSMLTLNIARAIEYMVIDVLLIAQKYMKFAEYIYIPEKYLHLTDDLLNRINMTESEVSQFNVSVRLFHFVMTSGTRPSAQ